MTRLYLVTPYRPWRCVPIAILAAAIVVSTFDRAASAQMGTVWSVSVAGEPVSMDDINQAVLLVFSAPPPVQVVKKRSEMPAYAPDLWYAGRGTDGKGILWYANPPVGQEKSSTYRVATERETDAALILSGLDAGKGSAKWRRLYGAVPPTPRERQAFAMQIVSALEAASAWSVATADANRQWLFATLHAGMTRTKVYALLDAHQITPTDASLRQTKPTSGDAIVTLPGAFEPGCSFTTRVTIAFDSDDRVTKLDLSEPIPDCL